jgi:cytosine permease
LYSLRLSCGTAHPVNAVDLRPVAPAERTQPAFDLFLIFAGANIVATTLVTGASLAGVASLGIALALTLVGSFAGAGLVAALAPVGPRLGVPSVVAARAALGTRGAALLALLLYVTNFAWIAANNLIAASTLGRVAGGPAAERLWVVALGVLATGVVMAGPRAVGRADRVAVPLMLITGAMLTLRFVDRGLLGALAGPGAEAAAAPPARLSWLTALDVVVGYQVSWILMFADYSRYTASAARGFWAVFLGLGLSSAWFIPLGLVGARAAGSADAGAIVAASGLGAAGALLIALATLTTNFVNIYLSALAWKSLLPQTGDRASIAAIGTLGTALALVPGAGLERYVDFMLVLGALLVPVGGVLLARLALGREHIDIDVEALYDPRGPYAARGGVRLGAAIAWALGAAVYFAAARNGGGTLPALVAAVTASLLLARLDRVTARVGSGGSGAGAPRS